MASRTGSVDHSGRTPTAAGVDRRTGRYLLAVYWLADDGERVPTGALSEYLDVTAATVSEAIEDLDDRDLVDHEKYRGVRLTERGRTVAARLVWRVCVVTNFFETVLETDLAEATSYEIGHALPAEGIERLGTMVDHPCVEGCPGTRQAYDGCLV